MTFILNLFIFSILQNGMQATINAENVLCQKVDFNRASSVVNEFRECSNENGTPNILKVNSYSASTITPFRSKAEYHLSAVVGFSCLQSSLMFTLDTNSEIRTAIYLNRNDVGAWVKVSILDTDSDENYAVADLNESVGWLAIHGKVNRYIENAQIEITTNMNANSMMAMEYLLVLNSAVLDEECADEDTEPEITPSPTDDPLPTNDPTEEPSDDPTDETEDGTTTENTTTTESTTTTSPPTTESPTASRSNVTLWMSLSILFFATTLITLVGLYYFVWLYRRLTRMQRITTRNTEKMNNLPRLRVKNGLDDGDPVIVGVEKFKNNLNVN